MRGKLAHWFGSGIYLGLGDWWKRMQRQGPRLPVKDQAEPGNTAASLAIMWLWKLRISISLCCPAVTVIGPESGPTHQVQTRQSDQTVRKGQIWTGKLHTIPRISDRQASQCGTGCFQR